MILFASDLDNTLIHSYKRADEGDVCVEIPYELTYIFIDTRMSVQRTELVEISKAVTPHASYLSKETSRKPSG